MEENFKTNIKKLTEAMLQEFRGFIVDGERIPVPDDLYHLNIAFQEMQKVPGWEYKSGTGQNPLIDYLKEKKAIYITKIETEKGKYQLTVGYLQQAYSFEVEYRGKMKPAYEVIKQIATGLEYDVDEYVLMPEGNKVEMNTYRAEKHIKKMTTREILHTHPISGGHSAREVKPIFIEGKLVGFTEGGKFKAVEKYRYKGLFKKTTPGDGENNGGENR